MGLLQRFSGQLALIGGRPLKVPIDTVSVTFAGVALSACKIGPGAGADLGTTGTIDTEFTVPLDVCINRVLLAFRDTQVASITTTVYSSTDGTCVGDVESDNDLGLLVDYNLETGEFIVSATVRSSGVNLFYANVQACDLTESPIVLDNQLLDESTIGPNVGLGFGGTATIQFCGVEPITDCTTGFPEAESCVELTVTGSSYAGVYLLRNTGGLTNGTWEFFGSRPSAACDPSIGMWAVTLNGSAPFMRFYKSRTTSKPTGSGWVADPDNPEVAAVSTTEVSCP